MKINGIEIKDGYLLVVETGAKTHNMTVISDSRDLLGCVTPGQDWWDVACFDKNGVFSDSRIVAIYGRTDNRFLLDNSTNNRKLLWKREEKPAAVKMTVAQICEKLGFEVEIIKE
jgi:hypothetical protein